MVRLDTEVYRCPRGNSSDGRAARLQREGPEFNSRFFHTCLSSAGVKFSLVMSKSKKERLSDGRGQMSGVGWGYGYVMSDDTPGRIVGGILTLIEMLGLPDKQEKPFKDMVTQKIWESFNDAISLKPETHTELREKAYREHTIARENGLPPNAI